MALPAPRLDNRTYDQLLAEALARIPVHNPEWTNFNDSDPGVTLVQLFSFLTENLIYRANQIPERNRRKFLDLLGVPLRAPASAQGIVTFANEQSPPATIVLGGGVEVRAGNVPFRTAAGLDVLPVETRVYFKRRLENPAAALTTYYRQLYASYAGVPGSTKLVLYESVPLVPPRSAANQVGIDLARDTVDGSLWLALLLPSGALPSPPRTMTDARAEAREAIGGKTVSLGVVPLLSEAARAVRPGANGTREEANLQYQLPIGGTLPADRLPRYRSLPARETGNVLDEPGVVQLTLPPAAELALWDDLDPLEAGVGDFPPSLDDTNLEERVLTWLRIRLPVSQLGKGEASAVKARLTWVGINAADVAQRARVANERLPDGTGQPDQSVFLAKTPVIPRSVALTVTPPTGDPATWA
jgi:hypothetical protein